MPVDVNLPPGVSGFAAGIASTLEFGRERVQLVLNGLSPEQLAAVPPGLANSIATLVVHICGTELKVAHWVHGGMLPDNLTREYMLDQPYSPLPTAGGEDVKSLTAKIDKARGLLVAALARIPESDLDRAFTFSRGRQVTVRWALSLLANHQSQHLGHMQMVRRLLG